MDKMYEMLLDRIDKKLSTKYFVIIAGIWFLIEMDYKNGIFWESLKVAWLCLLTILAVFIVYKLIIKRKVSEFVYQHDAKEYSDDTYAINCGTYKIVILHKRSYILWGQKPVITVTVINKTSKAICNLSGYIDLYHRKKRIVHEKLEIDYVLPKLECEQKLLEGELAYRNWENAKFVTIDERGEPQAVPGPIRVCNPDIDYWLIGNKTWYVIKEMFRKILLRLNWYWDGGSRVYRNVRSKRISRENIKKWILRVIICICAVIFVVWVYYVVRGGYQWIKLHIDT